MNGSTKQTQPNNVPQGSMQHRISPPPLKRRTGPPSNGSHQSSSRTSLDALPVRLSSCLTEDNRSMGSLAVEASTMNTGKKHPRHEPDELSPISPIPSHLQRLDHSSNEDSRPSTSSSITRSDGSSGSTSRKQHCAVCELGTNTKYNPMIRCAACQRTYHDGCRNPVLEEGADKNTWKCYRCLDRKQKRKASFTHPVRPMRGTTLSAYVAPSLAEHSSRVSDRVERKPNAPIPTQTSHQPSPLSTSDMGYPPTNVAIGPSEPKHNLQLTGPKPNPSPTLSQPLDQSISEKQGLILTNREKTSLSSRAKHDASKRVKLPNVIDSDELDRLVDDSTQIHENALKIKDNSLTPPNPQPQKLISRTMICPVCRKQRVLVRIDIQDVKCNNCKRRTAIPTTEERIIPETPDAAPTGQAGDRHLLETSKAGPVNPAPSDLPSWLTAKPHSLWFESGLVTSSPKISKKRLPVAKVSDRPDEMQESEKGRESLTRNLVQSGIGDTEDAAFTAPTIVAEASLDQKARTITAKGTVRSWGNMEKQTFPSAEARSADRMHQRPAKELPQSLPNHADEERVDRKQTKGNVNAPEGIASVPEQPTHGQVWRPSTSHLQTSVKQKKIYSFRALVGMALLSADDSPVDTNAVRDWVTAHFPDRRRGQGSWENSISATLSQFSEFQGERVAAKNKMRWKFLDQNAKAQYKREFPEYRNPLGTSHCPSTPSAEAEQIDDSKLEVPTEVKNQLPRGNSIIAIQDNSPRSHLAPLTRSDSAPRPGIVSAPAVVEAEMDSDSETETSSDSGPEMLADSESESEYGYEYEYEYEYESEPEPELELSSEVEVEVAVEEEVEAEAEAEAAAETEAESRREVQAEAHMDTDVGVDGEVDAEAELEAQPEPYAAEEICIPFERPSLQNRSTLELNLDIHRESSFHKVFPKTENTSVEMGTRSREDINKKIAEIKARPSRKAMFGSRLAHVRRLKQEDVHDERDGAWKPATPPQPQRAEDRLDNGTQDEETEQTLRDIFRLPANPIPMIYDGQLAFRDGTRVDGRLPRPRNVYKVGKRFAGEIRNFD